MNISFSTNKWTSLDLHDFMNIASEYKYTGIELHGIGGITDGMLTGMYRKLLEMKLKIPCIDVEADISEDIGTAYEEFVTALRFAAKLKAPYIRVRTSVGNGREFIAKALPEAEKAGVVILVETMGMYSDTAALRELLEYFASDSLGALWDFHYPLPCQRRVPREDRHQPRRLHQAHSHKGFRRRRRVQAHGRGNASG